MAKPSREYVAGMRARRLAEGVCVRCAKHPPRKDKTTCVSCAELQAVQEQALRAEMLAAGVCPQCKQGQVVSGLRKCSECLAKVAAAQRRRREAAPEKHRAMDAKHARNKRRRLSESGLCVICKAPSERYTCDACIARTAISKAKYKAKRRAMTLSLGLCTHCHKEQRQSNRMYCSGCLDVVVLKRYAKYGLTKELLAQYGTSCQLCGRESSDDKKHGRLHVDHDHESGKIRGLLCKSCNTGLGAFEDNRAVLLRAVAYLDKHKAPSFSDKFYRPSRWRQATA